MVNRGRSRGSEMLTRLLSFNLSEVRLKFNSRPSPNASRSVCVQYVLVCVRLCLCVLPSSGSVSSFKLSPGLFSLSGPHFIHAWGTPGAANNWIFHQGYFLERCAMQLLLSPSVCSELIHNLPCSDPQLSLWEELFDPGPGRRTCAPQSAPTLSRSWKYWGVVYTARVWDRGLERCSENWCLRGVY